MDFETFLHSEIGESLVDPGPGGTERVDRAPERDADETPTE